MGFVGWLLTGSSSAILSSINEHLSLLGALSSANPQVPCLLALHVPGSLKEDAQLLQLPLHLTNDQKSWLSLRGKPSLML